MGVGTEVGAFLPTTDVFDRGIIDSIDVNSEDFKDFIVRLYQTTNNIANAVNIRDAGYYVESEFVNGQRWFQNKNLTSKTAQTPEHRQVFRKVIDFGALLDTAAKNIAHGLTMTDDYTFTRIYGTASDTTGHTYIPIPYASPVLANSIEISLDLDFVWITTGSDRTPYDVCYVVIEYIKQ